MVPTRARQWGSARVRSPRGGRAEVGDNARWTPNVGVRWTSARPWAWSHTWWRRAAAVIAAWWGLFLGVYPRAMKAQRLAALEQNRQEQRDIGTDD